MKKITAQQISWNQSTNDTLLLTQYDDGSVGVEPITAAEAAQFTAETKY